MRKAVIITCLVLSGLLILDSMNAGQALMMFLLAGLIPGTDIRLSADTTLQLFVLALGFVFGRLTSRLLVARYFRPKVAALAE